MSIDCRYVLSEWIIGATGPGVFAASSAGIGTSVTGVMLMSLLWGIVAFSIPKLRESYHNLFEFSHRYFGWAIIPVLWAHVLLKASYYRHYRIISTASGFVIKPRLPPANYLAIMLERPNFYNAIIISILTLHPWFFVRKMQMSTKVPQKVCE